MKLLNIILLLLICTPAMSIAQGVRSRYVCKNDTLVVDIFFGSFYGDFIEVYANNIIIYQNDSLVSGQGGGTEWIKLCLNSESAINYTVRYKEIHDKSSYIHGHGGTWNRKLSDTNIQEINFTINHANEGYYLLIMTRSGPETNFNDEYMLIGYLNIGYAISKDDIWFEKE